MMKTLRTGHAHVFGQNIDTDQIYPARFIEYTEEADIKKYAMAGSDNPDFVWETQPGDFIVAGTNFGCGSSREHAAITLKGNQVGAIVAESFARIFFRNAINLGLPVITCPHVHAHVQPGDQLQLDLKAGEFKNLTNGWTAPVEPLDDYIMNILSHGGIKPLMRAMTSQGKVRE